MALSMRARLTAWYTALLVIALAGFCTVVLSIYWHTLVHQYDDDLDAMGRAAGNTLHNELAEGSSAAASAAEAEDVLRSPGIFVRVLDSAGHAVNGRTAAPPYSNSSPPQEGHATVTGDDGRSWRVVVRAAPAGPSSLFIEVRGSLDAAVRQWSSLMRASLIGLPVILLCAGGGGWWLARCGLQPLETMASEAQAITADSANRRLSRPGAAVELDAFAAAFNLVLDRLATALDNQRRFMADASHELRTPLSTIRTAADVTLSRQRSDDEYRDALATISQQSVRLGRLVDDMFLLARADAGGYPVRFEEVDLSAVVSECAVELGSHARVHGVDLSVSVPAAALVHGDEALLRRLVLNLGQNAIAYSKAGGRVRIDVIADAARIELRVVDNGPGIPDSERTRIFERFVRLDPSRHRSGAGLGLSIARWIAQVHGGALDLVSTGPSGSVFVARFPLRVPLFAGPA